MSSFLLRFLKWLHHVIQFCSLTFSPGCKIEHSRVIQQFPCEEASFTLGFCELVPEFFLTVTEKLLEVPLQVNLSEPTVVGGSQGEEELCRNTTCACWQPEFRRFVWIAAQLLSKSSRHA